ncbi:MAG TPA: substrate-binding domain-containing protein [Bradyrhizobium sp.]|nr:substrate-binding domain-containing protein [Bradyrhizobium sp.]
MTRVNILSGGAAQGLVASLAADFKARTGFDIAGDYGAVGAMADKLRGGMPTDLIILTAALVARLAEEGLVVPSSITDVGVVETAIAVRSRDPKLSVRSADELRAALLAADAIFVPDIKASTAGIHVANVLERLGIADAVAGRLQVYPNGATAMRHLAASGAARPIGCTQSTEIISTDGVELSGALPPGCELKTMYTAAVTAQAKSPAEATILIDLLTGPEARAARSRAGFAG